VRLSRLRVFQYRNFEDQQLELSPGTNLFVGRNGQGKTNLLEAVYFLAYGRSFRTSSPKECTLHGRGTSSVEGTAEREGLKRELRVLIEGNVKQLFLHGKAASVESFIGNLQVLAFTSGHLDIVRGGPSERRAFLDRAMITLFPGHLHALTCYQRALRQRNGLLAAALRGEQKAEGDLLESWDDQLVRNGARIIWHRYGYIQQLKETVPEKLFGAETLKLHYIAAADPAGGVEAIERDLRARLAAARGADLRSGFTTAGPHRDELKLYVEGKALADFGSAGQQRSALLSMYFAQMEIHHRTNGFYPVFLVDDVEAELDDERLRAFLGYLGRRTQVMLTTAKESFLPPINDEMRRFEIRSGKVV
jgi:DNA replication and repair protein RecF